MPVILIFDTETTGLLAPKAARSSRQPFIIEFYGEIIDGNSFHYLFNPGMKLPPKITAITGLRDSDLKDQPPFRESANKIVEIVESADIIVAHNFSFDKGIIEINLEREEIDPPKWPRGICTVEATEHLYGRRMSLGDLHQDIFGQGFKAHRAEEDVKALIRIFQKLLEDGEIIL